MTARGVNAREIARRILVCLGGSTLAAKSSRNERCSPRVSLTSGVRVREIVSDPMLENVAWSR